MARRLADGELVAFPGAREDLEAGVLRVLHDRSFIDDPTRMLRLVRYARRLGFEVDPETAALVDPSLFATVSGDRLGNELRLLIREDAMAALERFGLGRALLGDGFRAAPGLFALVDVPLDRFGFTAREQDVVAGLKRLRGVSGTDAELWRAFRRERPETIELLGDGGSATVARCRPAPQARDRRPRPARRRALRPRGRRGAGAGHGRDARGPRPGPRVAATRGYGGGRRRGSRPAGWRSR